MEGSSPNTGVNKRASATNWLRRCDGGANEKQKSLKRVSDINLLKKCDGGVNKQLSSSSYCDISWDDLAPEILKYLPFKSLCRFKCVSKSWRSMIVHDVAQKLVRQPIVLEQYCWNGSVPECHEVVRLCSIDGHTGIANHICTSPHLGSYISTNFVNGLFCYYAVGHDRLGLGLCNPMTDENILLPINNNCFMLTGFDFGFHPISNQYKLLACGNYPVCEIYTLGTTSWRQVRSTLPNECGKPRKESICIRGTMYWRSDTDMVISFDLDNESFGVIPCPQRLRREPRCKRNILYLFEFEGCLGLTERSSSANIMDLWLLKDCNANKGCKWVMMTSVAAPSKFSQWTRPYSTGNGELVLADYHGSPKVLYFFSLLKQQFDAIKVVGIDSKFTVIDYEKNSLSVRDL